MLEAGVLSFNMSACRSRINFLVISCGCSGLEIQIILALSEHFNVVAGCNLNVVDMSCYNDNLH